MATRAGWRHPRDDYAGAEALREEEDLRHCSFKPHLLNAAHTREVPSGGGYRGGSPAEDFARRCERWASRREATLQREREVQAAKELEECTFQPNVDLPDSSTRAAQAGPSVGTRSAPPLHLLYALTPHSTRRIPQWYPSQVVHVLATTAWGAVAILEHLTRQEGVLAKRDERDPRIKFANGSWLAAHRATYQA